MNPPRPTLVEELDPETGAIDVIPGADVVEKASDARNISAESDAETIVGDDVVDTDEPNADELDADELDADELDTDELDTDELDTDETEPAVEPEPEHDPAPETSAIPQFIPATGDVALAVRGLRKFYGGSVAVDAIDLDVPAGGFFGIVGPNGAGKTTTLAMVTGLLRPDAGTIRILGVDMWENPTVAKKKVGVLPDRLRLFDRLTGSEFLYHAGALRGLDRSTIAQRSADLAEAFGLQHSMHRLVSDYSAGMTKKIAIAAAMIHAPRLLVLDEPFESVDPVSSATVLDVLRRFTAAGGTVVLSSHSMELIERVCDSIAVIAGGKVLAAGDLEELLDGRSLTERFVELAGGESAVKGMEWLQNFSD